MSWLLPSCSKKCSRGVFRSSVQLAKKALNKTEELMPTAPLPTRSIKYLKTNTIKRGIEIEVKATMRSCRFRVKPIIAAKNKTENVANRGCRRAEKIVPTNPANEVTEKTSRRSIRAPLNPRKKNLIQN